MQSDWFAKKRFSYHSCSVLVRAFKSDVVAKLRSLCQQCEGIECAEEHRGSGQTDSYKFQLALLHAETDNLSLDPENYDGWDSTDVFTAMACIDNKQDFYATLRHIEVTAHIVRKNTHGPVKP
jgi:hypothetical protein